MCMCEINELSDYRESSACNSISGVPLIPITLRKWKLVQLAI